MEAAPARQLLHKVGESADVTVRGEMLGADHDEHRLRGEPNDPALPSAGHRDMQRPPLVSGDACGRAVMVLVGSSGRGGGVGISRKGGSVAGIVPQRSRLTKAARLV